MVYRSRNSRYSYASPNVCPHISFEGIRFEQTLGFSGLPKRRQRLSGPSCTHRIPAGLPFGIPGIGDEIDSAIQQAPQPILHFTEYLLLKSRARLSPCFPTMHVNENFIYLPHLPFISIISSLNIPKFLYILSFDRDSCFILSGFSSR